MIYVTQSLTVSLGSADMKICPYCAEEIREAAIRCRWCHADLRRRGARAWTVLLGAAFGLASLALLGASSPRGGVGDRTAFDAPFARVSDGRCPAADSALPPGHPPVGDLTPRLPPGHPPVAGMLPPGHPPVDGASPALPPGHPPLRGGPPGTVQPAPLAASDRGDRTYDL